jgi:hypothetical protein
MIMSKGYLVTKRIRGKAYLYRQRSWREAGKVRTECVCLGPVTDMTTSKTRPTAKPGNTEFGNPFKDRNTTSDETEFGNPFLSENARSSTIPTPAEYRAELKRATNLAQGAKENGAANGNGRKTSSTPVSIKRNTTKRFPKGVTFKGSLADYKISDVALAKEFDGLCHNLEQMGLDWASLPHIEIHKGKAAGWKKSWIKSRTYIITLPKAGGRTKFKRAYREALAACFLEELRRQNPKQYRKLRKAIGILGYGRMAVMRGLLAHVIQHGSKKSRQQFYNQKSSKKTERQRNGKIGLRVLEHLKSLGCTW